MSLPTRDEIKAYLRVQHTADDALLDRLRTAAIAAIETFLGASLTVGRTFELASASASEYATVQSARSGNRLATLNAAPAAAPYLGDHPDYSTRLEPVIGQVLIDAVADLYARRVSSVASESDAGGSTTYVQSTAPLPPRAVGLLRPIRRTVLRWTNR
jgi:hypothetical protein